MKKYLITITYKNLEVIRMVVGAANQKWANEYASNIIWQFVAGDIFSISDYEYHATELKNEMVVEV